ncbi:MAG: N-formylglutamate amidohydrolase [Pseudomonadota bacterium]
MSAIERAEILAELDPPFTVLTPVEQKAPFVFCSPHSGRVYPRQFLAQSRLDAVSLRRSEDCFVDELFCHVARLGAPMIAARFPRAFLDVNREPYELDPELIAGRLPDFANTQSVRVAGGLGTIARLVADGEEIYRERLPLAAALARVETLYVPFHARLAELIELTRRRFGYAVLIDCHSMPSSSAGTTAGSRPDFVLGDRFGASCNDKVTLFTRAALGRLGYDVHLNRPYAGGHITQHYGRPARGVHALQIEINRGLYMDERAFTPTASFDDLQRDLEQLSARLFFELPSLLAQRAAAE